MKIVYCINATFNSGGMERVLMIKANYLADIANCEVFIVTSQQHGRNSFFLFSERIKFYDLGINYDDDNGCNLIARTFKKWRKLKLHRTLLSDYLNQIKPDITISMFDYDFSFLYKIKDGSKKVLEFHFCKRQKIIEASNLLMKLIQWIRICYWKRKISRYDKFVVLTEEDKKDWGHLPNIIVIKNPIIKIPSDKSDFMAKQVLSIGRISYQKGFDRLLKAWALVTSHYPDWKLVIRGNGDTEDLQRQIQKLRINHSVVIRPATSSISDEYLNSSIFVMTSRYEGLPMVLMEAMSYGLPVVAFDFHCGPRDLINPLWGTIVPNGDISNFALKLMEWMVDAEKRKIANDKSRYYVSQYTQEIILSKWLNLFEGLVRDQK